MKWTAQTDGRTWAVDIEHPIDISIPLDLNGRQPRAFGVPAARSRAYAFGHFVGDTREGGSCNCETIEFNLHGSGTHTECVGHITKERISLSDIWMGGLSPATVVSVEPIRRKDGDQIIEKSALQNALKTADPFFLTAIVVRTLPNEASKQTRDYTNTNPPYLASEAAKFFASMPVRHLLIDLPSLEREDDGGKMEAHRIFFGAPLEYSNKTVTELVYVPNDVRDGRYFLNLQVTHFVSEASPSRPLLYRVTS